MKFPVWVWVLGGSVLVLAAVGGVYVWTSNPKNVTLQNFDSTFIHSNTISQSDDDLGKPDKQFIEIMIPYLENSRKLYDSSEKTESYKRSENVKALVVRITETQNSYLQQLKEMYSDRSEFWSSIPSPTPTITLESDKTPTEEKDFSNNMPRSEQELLRRMIRHAKRTKKMAFLVVDSAQDPKLRSLARTMIKQESQAVDDLYKVLEDVNTKDPEQGSVVPKAIPTSSTITGIRKDLSKQPHP